MNAVARSLIASIASFWIAADTVLERALIGCGATPVSTGTCRGSAGSGLTQW